MKFRDYIDEGVLSKFLKLFKGKKEETVVKDDPEYREFLLNIGKPTMNKNNKYYKAYYKDEDTGFKNNDLKGRCECGFLKSFPHICGVQKGLDRVHK